MTPAEKKPFHPETVEHYFFLNAKIGKKTVGGVKGRVRDDIYMKFYFLSPESYLNLKPSKSSLF